MTTPDMPLPGRIADDAHSSNGNIEKLKSECLTIPRKCQRLAHVYLARNYRDPQAREYAKGFARRLKILARCIDQTFKLLPPERIDLPTDNDLYDATINIQAFVFHVFGSADNLAWIWVLERNLANDNGSQLRRENIGLRNGNTRVRQSFSPRFQDYLTGLDAWFDYMANHRHALAHRLPLYILPYMLPKDNVAAYLELDNLMAEALNRFDLAEHGRLSAEQKALTVFVPYMTQSFADEAKFVVFHAQILIDFNTIADLGRKMLEELDRASSVCNDNF